MGGAMVRRFICLATILAITTVASTLSTGCSSAPTASQGADSPQAESCDDDCVRPPVRRADMLSHLQLHQERILARDDYKKNRPPPISEIIYGPLPNESLRSGPAVENANGEAYDGELNWHHIEFDDVVTDEAEHRSLRGRDVSGAHCFFAHKPNRLTAIFALLVVHHRDRGDVLYLGGPHHPVDRLDTVPITDRHGSRLSVDTSGDQGMLCAFRDDQQQMGAVIIPFEYADVGPPENGPFYAVFTVITGAEREPTGRTTMVTRAAGIHGNRTVEREVPEKKYRAPEPEFVDTYSTLHEAIEAAEEVIVAGNFRLRPEFVYPRMPYQSYLNTGQEEFCPINATCETPPKYLDKDTVPPLTMPEEDGDEEDGDEKEEDSVDGDARSGE